MPRTNFHMNMQNICHIKFSNMLAWFGAANFAELDSDFSEPGKHVWTFDMAEVLHVHVKVCVWHMSVGKYLVARKATTRLFRSCDDL